MRFFELHSDEQYDQIDNDNKYVSDYIDGRLTAVRCTSKPRDLYDIDVRCRDLKYVSNNMWIKTAKISQAVPVSVACTREL